MPNEENLPEWLEYLQGESPLLRRSEWMFIADIRSQIMKEIKSEPRISINEDVNLKEKLSFMIDNFKQVVKHLKMNRTHREYFMNIYPKWRKLRGYNIENLKKIANSIKEVRQKCQMANFIGSCVSLIGGGICLATGLRSNGRLRTGGSILTGLGNLTSAGSSVIEIGVLYSNIKEAEKTLKEDEECSKHLWEWLSDNSHLQKAMENIRHIDVQLNLKIVANMIQDALKKKRNLTPRVKAIINILRSLHIPPELVEEVVDVIGILVATSLLYDHYRPLFDLAFVSIKLSIQFRTFVDLFRAAAAVKSVGLTEVQKTTVAAGMVLDLTNIFLLCKDFESESKQAEMVTKAAGILEKETEIFEKLFNETEDIDADNFPRLSE